MWFLIKGTFWFSLVLVLLPFLDAESSAKLEKGPAVEIGDTFTAASEALHYVTAMCLEKPDVCEKGAETFVALGHRAREGARIAYQFLDTQFAEEGTAVAKADPAAKEALDQPLPAVATIDADDEVITGTVAIPTRRPDHKG
ncbi:MULTISPECIES: DUF5330 domain-containing protein [unclassified Shinella]|uniref:DUF5330 domain-containing protein n=1 Tax=Shinella TaxID=323620 RepID=UPI00225D73BC|nr:MULTISPECIES: DUF5330 domain-containing protein [unclassified Shinella]CAI0336774.1 conserved hypothetical protein [Rhizobiaceae bacterium]CAK7255303.1 DUF5330 domain-containing protein [Shinella sp. WSC3-e]MCO5136255.1 DUF5330 domain-containing protein [Shinella sp.]MCW5712484.1 DUF5330 domain-containing protein [Shinella sp.]MDC7254108.1 DUF5330 domain-containing protein [Shinella sp. YE25]